MLPRYYYYSPTITPRLLHSIPVHSLLAAADSAEMLLPLHHSPQTLATHVTTTPQQALLLLHSLPVRSVATRRFDFHLAPVAKTSPPPSLSLSLHTHTHCTHSTPSSPAYTTRFSTRYSHTRVRTCGHVLYVHVRCTTTSYRFILTTTSHIQVQDLFKIQQYTERTYSKSSNTERGLIQNQAIQRENLFKTRASLMVSTGVRRRAEREEYVTFAFTVMSIYGHSCHTLHVRVEETFIVIMSVE